FLAPIEPGDLTHFDIAVLVRPILQDGIEVQAHRNKTSNTSRCLVNNIATALPVRGNRLIANAFKVRPQPSVLQTTRLQLQCEKWKTRSSRLSVSSRSSVAFLKIIS